MDCGDSLKVFLLKLESMIGWSMKSMGGGVSAGGEEAAAGGGGMVAGGGGAAEGG